MTTRFDLTKDKLVESIYVCYEAGLLTSIELGELRAAISETTHNMEHEAWKEVDENKHVREWMQNVQTILGK